MAEIPFAEKKLREAEFFFGHLQRAAEGVLLASEQFEFYFNAFVSAGRSVGFVLKKEQTALYESWYGGWIAAIPGGEQLMKFMNFERVGVLKQEGHGSHRLETEMVNMYDYALRTAPLRYGRDRRAERGAMTIQPHVYDQQATIGVQSYSFEYNGTRLPVLDLAREYLELLRRQVSDFKAL